MMLLLATLEFTARGTHWLVVQRRLRGCVGEEDPLVSQWRGQTWKGPSIDGTQWLVYLSSYH